jgi:hypothetical protein
MQRWKKEEDAEEKIRQRVNEDKKKMESEEKKEGEGERSKEERRLNVTTGQQGT